MVERETPTPDEVKIAQLYSKAHDVVMLGKRYSPGDSLLMRAHSFFCDKKDITGSSDIKLQMDITSESDGLIKIRTERNQKSNKILVRIIHLSKNKIEKLIISDGIVPQYNGPYDKLRLSLENLDDWLSQAKTNLEAQAKESPCRDEKKPRLIALTTKIKDRLFSPLNERK